MIYNLKEKQFLPISLDEAWAFFSCPNNLEKLTPPDIGFEIINNHSDSMHEGQIISYRIQLLPLVKIHWVTEITTVVDKKSFIDNQLIGPYKLWHHQHRFEEVEGGVMMEDLVHYAVPFGIFGKIAHVLFVKAKLKSIFNYRREATDKLFSS